MAKEEDANTGGAAAASGSQSGAGSDKSSGQPSGVASQGAKTTGAASGGSAGAGDGGQKSGGAESPGASTTRSGTAKPARSGEASDPVAMLKQDHRKVEGIFDKFEAADEDEQEELIQQACEELIIHSLLEERIFYPASRQPSTDDLLDEAQVEHDAAKVLIVELMEGDRSDEFRKAKFKVLSEQMKQHIKEEEAPDGVFAKAQKAGVNTRELGEHIAALKQQLLQRAQSGRLPDPEPASFTYFGEPSQKERFMPRERDDQGRFTSDDDRGYRSRGRDYDDDRGRGSSGRERDSQGRFMSDDDDRGRRSYSSRGGGGGRERGQGGWFGDSEGHSEASRRGWEERDGGSRSRSYRDDDDDRGYRSRGGGGGGDRGQGGWFRDSEGHSEAARRGWDNPNHGESGWFGDSRGHSEASRRGWDNPDHGDSGWYGDSRGHSEASRRGWDNPDHGRSGWYGDSEGHSEASRRGWDERGRGEQRSYARGRDDYDDDDDRGSRSRGRSGHGGWSGDPEGHSEASRRGWQNRR